jgi:formate dehydrogenase (coenzyme F420) beta subunit
MQAWIEIKDGDILTALRTSLRTLLSSGHVDALLAPCRVGRGDAVVHTLIVDEAMLDDCDPLAPVLPANAAALVSRLTAVDTGRRLGVVLRPCELRALVELTKLHQITLEHVTTIGIDCLGTYEPTDYAAMLGAGLDPAAIWSGAMTGEPAPVDGYPLRTACQMCEHLEIGGADIQIGLIGLDYPHQMLIESQMELPELSGQNAGDLSARQTALARLTSRRVAVRDQMFSAWRGEVHDIPSLMEQFAACIRCHNCMIACPICYCKECIFRTPTFDHESRKYFQWADRRGALRMPTDTLLFHVTRLNHMATSCVGCGMCDSACPRDLPVATVFRAVAERVQALFDYEAGRSLEEEAPLATFREDELQDVES